MVRLSQVEQEYVLKLQIRHLFSTLMRVQKVVQFASDTELTRRIRKILHEEGVWRTSRTRKNVRTH